MADKAVSKHLSLYISFYTVILMNIHGSNVNLGFSVPSSATNISREKRKLRF